MRYTTLAAATAAMATANADKGYAPTAVYWCDAHGGYYTLVSAWVHRNMRDLTLVLS